MPFLEQARESDHFVALLAGNGQHRIERGVRWIGGPRKRFAHVLQERTGSHRNESREQLETDGIHRYSTSWSAFTDLFSRGPNPHYFSGRHGKYLRPAWSWPW